MTKQMVKKVSRTAMPEGLIEFGHPFATEIGFTADGFTQDSYLWGYPKSNGLYLSLIISKKKGAFCQMIKKIEERGYKFRIPTPSDRMVEIGKKQGWKMGETIQDGEYVRFLTNED